MTKDCFIPFGKEIDGIALPEKFTFPFYYDPHPLALMAAKSLQDYLENQDDFTHNFGLDPNQEGLIIGKMFGVLVVQNADGHLGYIAAFSGKLAGGNHHQKFVPPLFDMLTLEGFFRKEEEILNSINSQIEILGKDPYYEELKQQNKKEQDLAHERLSEQKAKMKTAKSNRKQLRIKAQEIEDLEQRKKVIDDLGQESIKGHFFLRDLNKYWQQRLLVCREQLGEYQDKINILKEERKTRSSALQKKLFKQYSFLNQSGETKDLTDIFENELHRIPPKGIKQSLVILVIS